MRWSPTFSRFSWPHRCVKDTWTPRLSRLRSCFAQYGTSRWPPAVKPSAKSSLGFSSAREARKNREASRLWLALNRWAQARLALKSEVAAR